MTLKNYAAYLYREVAENKRHLPTFSESVELIYENLPANMDKHRDVIVETERENLADMMIFGDFRDLLQRNAMIALDIPRAVGRSESGKRSRWEGHASLAELLILNAHAITLLP
jgi:hypothetical protein